MTTQNQLLVALAATFALTATRARAQVVLGPAVTPAECTAAAAALSSGQNRNGRGWERLAACGVTGEGPIATAIATAVSETDSVYLDHLWLAGTNLRSREIFNVSRAVANNASATVSARVTAIWILLAEYDPSVRVPFNLSWTSRTTVPMGSWCTRFSNDPHGMGYASVVSAPTPGELKDAAAVLENIAKNQSNPGVLRDLARCGRIAMLKSVPEVVPSNLIALHYVCGTRFRIENGGQYWVELKFRVVGTSEVYDLNVGPNKAITHESNAAATVELVYNGQVIRTTANGGTMCS